MMTTNSPSIATSAEVHADKHGLMNLVDTATSAMHNSSSHETNIDFQERDSTKTSSPSTVQTSEETHDVPVEDSTTNNCCNFQAITDSEVRQEPQHFGLSHIHSAAALFRRHTEKSSRKHTRPPMSKVFMSLQLTPENFIELQTRAKAYMLDPSHPERQNCVGNRGKGDTDIVKLRLFNCVREFLKNGAGERFFGRHVSKPGSCEITEAARALGDDWMYMDGEGNKTLIWPRDGNRIITVVTPLMRRMVTNERQRRYAIATRKSAGRKKSREESGSDETSSTQSPVTEDVRMEPVESEVPTVSSVTVAAVQSGSPKQEVVELVETEVERVLTNINVFLVIEKHIDSPSRVFTTKLAEKRIGQGTYTGRSLVEYSWNTFRQNVHDLLEQTLLKTPSNSGTSASHTPIHPDTEIVTATEDLRRLAVATNALNHETHITEVTHSNLRLQGIKTLGESGWDYISDSKRWSEVLVDRAERIWCDGVITFIVEVEEVVGKAD